MPEAQPILPLADLVARHDEGTGAATDTIWSAWSVNSRAGRAVWAWANDLPLVALEGGPAPALPHPGERLLGAEKLAREKGVAPWSYYSMKDGRPFFMAGLWAEAADPATGEVADTYTLIITDANATMRVHDRMPVILATDAARQWIEPGPLPAELLVPYPAEEMTAWRVADDAKNSRIEPHAGMAEPVAAA